MLSEFNQVSRTFGGHSNLYAIEPVFYSLFGILE